MAKLDYNYRKFINYITLGIWIYHFVKSYIYINKY